MSQASDAAPAGRQGRPSLLSTLIVRQETTLVGVIAVIAAMTALRNPAFVAASNVIDIFRASVIYFVMACGAGLLMIAGGLDFSVGAVFTLGGIVSSWLMIHGVPWPVAAGGGIVAGVAAGVVNDLVIVRLHVPPIIATLGTFFIISGLCIQITGGEDLLPLPEGFQAMGQGDLFGVPLIVCYAALVGVAFWFLLEHTPFGVTVRALGGNRKAAVANGLKVARLDRTLYVLAGATAALAGVIYAARVGSGQVTAGGASVTLSVVTAVLIGGTSLLGGLGSVTGIAIGAVLLSEIDNALIIASVPPQYNSMVVGTILICAVAVDHVRRERLYRARR